MDDLFSTPADPTTNFLAREAAILGTASLPSPSNSNFNTHDFEANAGNFPDLDDDFLGATRGEEEVRMTGEEDFGFEQQFPELEEEVEQTGNGVGMSAGSSFDRPVATVMSTTLSTEEDSEAIRSWRIKQAEEIAKREVLSKEKKEATIIKAQNDIDNFYKQYNAKKAKNIAANKEQEAALEQDRVDALAQGTTWERICDLVELKDSRSKTNSKSSKDLGRFREILLLLRKEKEAPGATY